MRLRWPWLAALAVFIACIPLFGVEHCFFGDWPNHLGMIGYFGEYLKAHGRVPGPIHTVQTVGRASTLFYGTLYLPVLGVLSAFFGPWGALSIGVAALLFLQFASVRALVLNAAGDEAIACAAATIVTWEIYPLTDLYNRGATPEFLAITAMQTGACLWALYARDPARHDRASLGAGLLLTIGAGTHPPSALFGCLTFGVLWLASLLWTPDRRRVLKRSVAVGVGAGVVLAPWAYVVHEFREHLQIVHEDIFRFFPNSLDAVSTRLSLVPTLGPDGKSIPVPYLDAQISVPLVGVVVLLGLLVALERVPRDRRTRRALAFAAVSSVTACFLFALSTGPSAWNLLPKAFKAIQYPYRLVAFVNVATLAALLGVLVATGRERAALHRSRWILGIALAAATVGIGLKVPRGLGPGGGADAIVNDYVNPPGDWYYAQQDYATPDLFPKLPPGPKEKTALTVTSGADYAAVGPAHVRFAARTLVSTNVQAFAWNVLTVDGQPVPHDATFADGPKLATWIDAGEHDIGYEFHPAALWSVLHAASLSLLFAWACAWAFGPVLARRLARRREPAPALEIGTP